MAQRRSGADTRVRTFAAFKRIAGDQLDETVIVDVLQELYDAGVLAGVSARPAALTRAEVDFLDEHSGVRENREALLAARLRSAADAELLDKQSLTVEEAAKLLAVSPSRVRHRIADGSIYAFPSQGRGHRRSIPAWQFTPGGGQTPYLGQVLAALPEDFTPLDVQDFVMNVQLAHPSSSRVVGLLEWLRSGADPTPAIEIAAEQDDTI